MNEIEITTSQNITIHYELASVWERSIAYFVDACILSVALWMIYLFSSGMNNFNSGLLYSLTLLPVFVFYSLFFELFNNGQSPGKLLIKLRVIKLDGEKTTFTDYLMRWMFRGIDIYGSLGSIAILGVVSSSNNQRLGDLLANTIVVSLRKDNRMTLTNLLKLNTNHIITFPNVVNLNEESMIIVKEVLKKQLKYRDNPHQQAVDALVIKLTTELKLEQPKNKIQFLKTLLTDYIILTR